jgi:hypothetical protein
MSGTAQIITEFSEHPGDSDQESTNTEISSQAGDNLNAFKPRRERRLRNDIRLALENNRDIFFESWSRKPKSLSQLRRPRKPPKVLKKRGKPKHHCKLCNKHFSTSLFAMGRHAGEHRNNSPIKLYEVKNSTSDFRPEERIWNSSLRERFPGSDAHLVSAEPPSDMLNDVGQMIRV